MRSVLLAWELGSGYGHVTVLRRLAARFASNGLKITAAVRNLSLASGLAADGIELLQAPLWPGFLQSPQEKARHSSITMGDTLGDAGLGKQEALRSMLGAWEQLIALTKPGLVIADYAPCAAMAARDRIPLAWVGNGFTLPPPEMDSFPILHRLSAAVWKEEDLLSIINAALSSLRLRKLERLPQLFAGDARWLQTVPLLDPYHAWRKQPADGPMLERLPEPRRDDAAEILVYISTDPRRPGLLQALTPLAARTRIFAPGLPAAERDRLACCGLRIEEKPFRLSEELAAVRLFIHLGSAGVSAETMLAGVPQLVLSVDIEKDLIGDAMQAAGIGRMIKIHDPAMALTPDIVASLLDDDAMAQQAMDVANAHRVLLRDADPFSDFEAACMNLVK